MNPIRIRVSIATLCLILTALFSQTTRAQTDGYLTDSNMRGLAPGNSFQSSDIDYINLGNGALNLHIPLVERKGRGLDSRVFVTYSSKIWAVSPVWDGILPNTLDAVRWSYSPQISPSVRVGVIGLGPGGGILTYNTDGASCTVSGVDHSDVVDYGFIYTTPDGSTYQFPNRHVSSDPPGPPRCVPGTGNTNVGYSDNGVFELDTATAYTVHYKNGRLPLTDTNGNFFDVNGDTLRRTINATGNTLTVLDSNGNNETYTLQSSGQVSSTTQFPTTSCGTVPIQQYSGGFGGTTTFTLPSGRTYVFSYDPTFNEVTKVTLPTGGYIRYQYTTLPSWDYGPYYKNGCALSLDSRRISARFVSPDGNPQDEQQWQYSYGLSGGVNQTTVTDPLGNITVHSFGASGDLYAMHETLTQYYDNAGHLLRSVSHTWTSDGGPVQRPMGGPTKCDATNWRMTSETTTLPDTNQVKQIQTNFDSFSYSEPTCGTGGTVTTSRGNVTSQLEYDWGNGSPGPLLLRTVYTYLHDSNSNYLTKHILDRVASKTIYDSTSNQCQGQSRACAQTTYGYDTTSIAAKSGVVQHDYTTYPSTMIYRGNPTTISRWRNTDGAWLTTTNYYDELGNLIQTTDPLSHNTYFDYTDSWSGTACIPSGGTGNAFVTKTTNALSQFVTAKYYPCTSLVASTTDLNSQTMSFNYDGLDRSTLKTLPDGGQVATSYNDVPPVSATFTTKINSTQNLITAIIGDGLGRTTQSQTTSGPLGTVSTDTTYDALGRVHSVSNPHVTGASTTDGITTYVYDALGRTCVVVPPDGTAVSGGTCPATQPTNDLFTSYSGNTTTVADQAGKSRKSVTDGLGRLTQVFEDPFSLNYETDYQYDTLGNLLCAVQKGTDTTAFTTCAAAPTTWRPRSFTYNSLSQLLTAINPESGTITYAYNSDGTLATKIAPAPNQTGTTTVTSTYSYDALHRMTQKSFSDTTPTVKYGYDAIAPTGCTLPTLTINNGIGKRTGMCDAAGAEAWSYDITANVGWKLTDARTTNSVTPPSSTIVQNNLVGSPATLTYPSGRIITYSFDAASRPVSAIDSIGPINYATTAAYAPTGALSSFTNGASIVSTLYYNNRLQPCRISVKNTGTAPASCTDAATGNVLDFSYNFSLGSSDNGNVTAITNNRDTTRSQTFSYDSLNRMAVAETTSTHATSPSNCWGEAYFYDNLTTAGGGWGNLTTITSPSSAYTGCTGETLGVSVLSNNQISGFCYDAAGNLLAQSAPPCPVPTYTYNAENQMTLTAGVTYTYDGDGKRVQKSSGKLYWYGMGSDPLDETDLAGNTNNASFNEYIFFGGKRIARRDYQNNVNYYFADHLGTARVSTNSTGSVCYDADFYPFGGERIVTDTCDTAYKFTGKERDSESGLDNFGARYNSSAMGRFMSPDIGAFHLGNPQSLNRYTYALNNPLFYIDPDGEDSISAIYHLGTATVNTFVASGEPFDAGGMLASLSGGLEHLPLSDFENSQPMAAPGELETGQSHSDTSGGCLIGGCVGSFDTVPAGVSISLSFNYDPDTNKLTGATIGYSVDSSATFIGPDRPTQKYARVPLPGLTPPPEISSVKIDPSVLSKLSSAQLGALFNATSNQPSSIRDAIRNAVIQEQKRRAEEQRKKEEEERRRKCQQDGKKDCV